MGEFFARFFCNDKSVFIDITKIASVRERPAVEGGKTEIVYSCGDKAWTCIVTDSAEEVLEKIRCVGKEAIKSIADGVNNRRNLTLYNDKL